jgi:hypothetical protein
VSKMKQAILIVCVAAIVGALGSAAMADTLEGPLVNPANGHEYYLLDRNTWSNSEAEAITLGGHLVTINDASENSWVRDKFGADKKLWLGLNDVANEGSFVWSSGEPVTYTNWRGAGSSGAEPNNDQVYGPEGEDYTHMFPTSDYRRGTWNDFVNVGIEGFYDPYGVVEVPEPATLTLLTLGGLAILRRRRKR